MVVLIIFGVPAVSHSGAKTRSLGQQREIIRKLLIGGSTTKKTYLELAE